MFLMDTGPHMMIYIGTNASPQVVQRIFGGFRVEEEFLLAILLMFNFFPFPFQVLNTSQLFRICASRCRITIPRRVKRCSHLSSILTRTNRIQRLFKLLGEWVVICDKENWDLQRNWV